MSVINVVAENDLSNFTVVFDGSVLNETPGFYGVSHLWEHLKCKEFKHLMDTFEMEGISWNASTSDTVVRYYISGLDEYVSKHRVEYLDCLLKFSTTEEEFENEKKIVLEEYKDCFNSQSKNHYLNFFRKKFNYFGAIGLKEDLENLTFENFKKFNDLYYSKPSKIINVSKYSEFNTDIQFAVKEFDNTVKLGEYDATVEPFGTRNGKSSIINMSNVITEDFPYIDFITDMLGGGLKSPLYQEIREKRGLVYYLHCYLDGVTNNDAVIVIASETSDENVDEFQKTLEMVLSDPDKYMTQERFDIVKQSITISIKKANINKHTNIGKYITPIKFQIEPLLDEITLDKVMEVYHKYFNFSNFITSVDTNEKFILDSFD